MSRLFKEQMAEAKIAAFMKYSDENPDDNSYLDGFKEGGEIGAAKILAWCEENTATIFVPRYPGDETPKRVIELDDLKAYLSYEAGK